MPYTSKTVVEVEINIPHNQHNRDIFRSVRQF